MKLVSSFKTFSPFAKCVPMGIGDWHENLGQNMLMSIERKTLNFLDEKTKQKLRENQAPVLRYKWAKKLLL
jgi:hypothetical protein